MPLLLRAWAAQPALSVASGRPSLPAHVRAEANLGLVRLALSRRFSFLLADESRRADAFTYGYLGLVRAAEKFDPAWGVAFSSYAVPTIESYVLRFLALERRQARLPTVPLETPLGAAEDFRLEDTVADPQAETPGAALLERDGFEQMLAPLPLPHRAVLRALYADGQTMEEVGAARGVTKQRIEQIHKEALRRLRRAKSRNRPITGAAETGTPADRWS